MEKVRVIELAIALDRSVPTIYNWVAKGLPYATDEYGTMLFDIDEVKKWVKENVQLKHTAKKI